MPQRVAVIATAECAHPKVSLAPVVPRSAAPRGRPPGSSGKLLRVTSPAMQPRLPYPRLAPGGGLDFGPLLVIDPGAANGYARIPVAMADHAHGLVQTCMLGTDFHEPAPLAVYYSSCWPLLQGHQ